MLPKEPVKLVSYTTGVNGESIKDLTTVLVSLIQRVS